VDSLTPDEPRRAPIRWHVATVRDARYRLRRRFEFDSSAWLSCTGVGVLIRSRSCQSVIDRVMSDLRDTGKAVRELAYEHPDWIPVLRAACVVAERTEGFEFAGRWVLQEWQREAGTPSAWQPGLRRLVAYGLIEKVGESTRGGRRAYYRMPDRLAVERALEEIGSEAT
jgi:hypothetical protein